MSVKQFETVIKNFAKLAGVAYLVGLFTFLGTELHARETQYDEDAIRVPTAAVTPTAYSQASYERLKAFDSLVNASVRKQISDLRAEVVSLRRQVDDMKWNSGRQVQEVSRVLRHHRNDDFDNDRRPQLVGAEVEREVAITEPAVE